MPKDANISLAADADPLVRTKVLAAGVAGAAGEVVELSPGAARPERPGPPHAMFSVRASAARPATGPLAHRWTAMRTPAHREAAAVRRR